ncbi:hypothetical protein T440DRAFT_484134 [Plenodomus tracheiphilus IPT5]|uniref:BTB domain-containing protein n=1 Tax=Plenodomus tracheiphilus IPT5 TaxID=1408161 RepID=A0A6A7AN64_9PLEO|nr:hypothetical protein T440DRAFT_484134 [Plenodomus tracheiphilus IPT5]
MLMLHVVLNGMVDVLITVSHSIQSHLGGGLYYTRVNGLRRGLMMEIHVKRATTEIPIIQYNGKSLAGSWMKNLHGNISIYARGGVRFDVSRYVLEEAGCFGALLKTDGDSPPYQLEKESTDALRILILILHHKPCNSTYSTLATQTVYNFATLCEKYGLATLMAPHVETWIGMLWGKHGRPNDRDWMAWLWILEVFHPKSEQLERVLDVVAANMREDAGNWVFENYQDKTAWAILISKMASQSGLTKFQDRLLNRRNRLHAEFTEECNRCRAEQPIRVPKHSGSVDVLIERWTTSLLPEETLMSRLVEMKGNWEQRALSRVVACQMHILGV